MTTPLSIAFQGAARTVTGSRHLMKFGKFSWLFDCGLYQGRRDEADQINRTFRFDPAGLDAVIISHAHLDHIGNLPTLVNLGFRGPIHMTAATADLARVMLEDSASLMEKDLEHVNKRRRDRPERKPLYTIEDVNLVLERLISHPYHQPWSPFEGVSVVYHDAGHIIGAALTTFEFTSEGQTRRVLMGGDLGRPTRPILRDPEFPPGSEVLVLESTYGDRLHSDEKENERQLVEIVTRTIQRGGRVVVPSFAVGRTQELVAVLHSVIERGLIPELPIFVDSPMARETTAVYKRHPECFDAETRALISEGEGAPFGFTRLRYVGSAGESRALNDLKEPCIIISASGMCEGGRVVHHLLHALGNPVNTVLFVGFQGEGTLGRKLRDGQANVNVMGEPVQVRAEIASLDGFSAHADQAELLGWVTRLKPLPRVIHLVHGEIGPMEILAALLREKTGATVHIPEKGQEFDLWTS